MSATVREFISDCYQLISASSPNLSLEGSDLSTGIRVMNRLLNSYAATGLYNPIAKTETINIPTGTNEIIIGPASYSPTPDITVGRLSNLEFAWLVLDDVTYPLLAMDRAVFNQRYKYETLQALPRFIIPYFETEITRLQIYPQADQTYEINIRGKYQLTNVTSNDDMSLIPDYMQMPLQYHAAKFIAMQKGRASAWTQDLELMLRELMDNLSNASEVDLAVTGSDDMLLNGAFRVKAGV